MNFLLRAFSVETLISFVITFLDSTVKNPDSARAKSLIKNVTRLRNACDEFITAVETPNSPL